MIEIVEPDDIKSLFNKVDILNERTKKHTLDIQELRRMIKDAGIDKV